MDSPGGSLGALQPVSHNPQRAETPNFGSPRRGGDDARDSAVHDKISQFNTLAMQSKQLERKTADAALKRAMVGREEAECEMRRYRDEVRLLKKHVEEGKERERRVGERLETVMVRNLLVFSKARWVNDSWLTNPYGQTGELRAHKRNSCTHPGFMGKGNPPCSEGDIQGPEFVRKTSRGAQVGSDNTKVGRR